MKENIDIWGMLYKFNTKKKYAWMELKFGPKWFPEPLQFFTCINSSKVIAKQIWTICYYNKEGVESLAKINSIIYINSNNFNKKYHINFWNMIKTIKDSERWIIKSILSWNIAFLAILRFASSTLSSFRCVPRSSASSGSYAWGRCCSTSSGSGGREAASQARPRGWGQLPGAPHVPLAQEPEMQGLHAG